MTQPNKFLLSNIRKKLIFPRKSIFSKKAFEIQFNWIFVLVAGASILIFFAVIIAKQRSISEVSINADTLKSIEAIINGASISTDTTSIIKLPNSEIEVGCNTISLGSLSRQYQALILFAPSIIKGDKLITQTQTFSAPSKITNMLYIASPQARYIIIGDTPLAGEVNRSLPKELKKEFYKTMPLIKNANNYKVKFVIFGDIIGFPPALEGMSDLDVTAIKVNGDIDKGTIEFYQKDGSSWASKGSSFYLTKSALLGAVYSDDLALYECNMKNVFAKINLMTKIYAERTGNLLKSSTSKQCSDAYTSALAHLNIISSASLKFNKENADLIASSSMSLSNENKNVQTYSCTLIF